MSVNQVGSAQASKTTNNNSQKPSPSDAVLKRMANELKVSVNELKSMLKTSGVPKGKGIAALARESGMDMKMFCQLNGIEYSKWRDYKAKDKEVFYIIGKPDNSAKQKTTPAKPAPAKTETKPKPAPAKPQQAPKASTIKTPAAANKAKWGSDYTPAELAKNIYSLSKKYYGAVGKPDFDALVSQVNPKNASAVIKEYKKLNGESLLHTLTREVRSDEAKRKQAALKVYDALAKAQGTPAAVRNGFVKELNDQFDSIGFVNTKKLDETLNRMMASPAELAQKMKNDIHGKWGASGTDSFNELMALVTPRNAQQVIKAYDDLKTGETLIKGISREVNSSKDARKADIMHVYDMLAMQKGSSASKRAEFQNELNKEFNSLGLVSTKKLDEMINSITGSSAAGSATPASESKGNAPMPIKDLAGGNYKVKLGNGKTMTANSLRKDAITSARKDEGFNDVKNPHIIRPLPNVNSAGKIEAASEIHLPTGKNGPMKGKVVIVNAGHGGYGPKNGFFDAGTVLSVKDASGQKRPIEEWRVAGSYTEDLTKKLQAKGATVVVVSGPVRNGGMAEDKYLENLLAGNRGSADVRKLFKGTNKSNIAFVSIHVESVKTDPKRKACTVRANNDAGDQALAQKIQKHVGKNIFCLRPEIATNDYYVTRAMGPKIPAVLLELGNIANDNIAASLLSSNDRGKYTQAVADALEETLLKK